MLCTCLLCNGVARAQEGPEVVPPEVAERVAAAYPPSAVASGGEVTVLLEVTVDRDGAVTDVVVAASGGPEFDEAALLAVKLWRFVPARSRGEAVASRISVPFVFRSSSADSPDELAAPTPSPVPPAPTTATHPEVLEVTVEGEREPRRAQRSASDFRIRRDVLDAAPRQEGAEVLRAAPGIYLGRGEGAAVAHSYSLRGFDAEHGQDIEFHVGGLPINSRSHLHGQGYADLGFLIAETVQELRVSEGVYDPRQGDFAVAGSIDVDLGVERRGVLLESAYGSFGTHRQLMVWAPPDAERETFGAAQYVDTGGFGENRAGRSGSAIVQHRFGSGHLRYRAVGILYGARADLAGVLRADDVEAGRVCFYCVYPYATARSQNASAQRVLTGFFVEHRGEGDSGELGIWLGYDVFRLQSNFTGFTQTSQTLARVAGRGDLIEQQNRATSLGLTAWYRTDTKHPASWAHVALEVGVDGRVDDVEQGQNLLDAAVRNQTWDRRVDAGVHSLDLGVWADADAFLTHVVRASLGVRADVLSYEVEDRLGNFAPLSRPDDAFIVGFRRSAFGVAWGPRASAEVLPLDWLSVRAAYGEGYRSPQARTLDDGEEAPFTKVRSADVGLRFDWGEPLRLTLAGYHTHLSDDVAFDAADGRLERIGETRRRGAVVYLESRPAGWLVESLSATYVDATLLEPPPASAEEPFPPFERGQSLPFVPPLVVRMDLGAHGTLTKTLGRTPLEGRAGAGFSFLSPRPLPHRRFADPVALLDVSAGLAWEPFALDVEVFNLLDRQYAALEYSFPSSWDPDGARSRTPARHIAAGAPLSWLVTLGVRL